jgi:hypothetical protein
MAILFARCVMRMHPPRGRLRRRFTIECPRGLGATDDPVHVAEEISRRLASIFLRNQEGS